MGDGARDMELTALRHNDIDFARHPSSGGRSGSAWLLNNADTVLVTVAGVLAVGVVILVGAIYASADQDAGLHPDILCDPHTFNISRIPLTPNSSKEVSDWCAESICVAEWYQKHMLKHHRRDSLSKKTLLRWVNRQSIVLDTVDNVVGLLSLVHPDEEIRKASEECAVNVSAYFTELLLDETFFKALQAVQDQSAGDALGDSLFNETFEMYKRNGAALPAEQRKRLQ
ncbi:hypothetical protein CYMTET_36220, partial [Cymbomonas tetramitiformis]